ncbi:Uncharacterized membrane protein YoaK, UPF0700 family [Pseudomonas cuatrocienegasensis]|uniref:Uncharacterized membrane protein YoaK, UPF0700 family n=1 Tax=Pseudomonas cuatrocienegasensis TaxID=543360 RepID=A0ABY1BHX7_9PSED|nr:hypothetical protein A7D25_13430 [Pseudomonas sp. 21C1]SEQ90538.1 Uncharacterized membrane protein YoaK, UPF0700 family [Pseudomonas cuatrocienegasensis]
MPINYARRLIGSERSDTANRHLGFALAFVAGAINAGGFLAVQQYTSHMTGIVSSMADNIVLGAHGLVLAGLGGVVSFLLGAVCSTLMIHYSRRRQLHSEYALPLLLEAVLLLCFGLLGSLLATVAGLFVPLTVMLLCFIMGLQNALITKLSRADIRTTHVTGIITDIGIELGKLCYWNRSPGLPSVGVDRQRLRILLTLLGCFFLGGVLGALGFNYLGYVSTVPLALFLVLLAGVPAVDDVLRWLRRRLAS